MATELDSTILAPDVVRGVTRLFARSQIFAIAEVPLPNNRRADLMGIDTKGRIVIVEIKVQRSDLLGDCKWQDYLDYCDHFYWAVTPELASICDGDDFLPDVAGLIVADRYDAAFMRQSAERKLAPARRKAETLRFARRAGRRLAAQVDPSLGDNF
ncbi:MmcB family DNA repair protein [Sphingomicrobium marinum]|uniref:MmcB family DNA repair protein n=1 Tax=Sphingomicrobium marinum TaxID=1227950 RepID=UPI00224086F5|nr:MmcB family DNA repair protein [Sphingomicrobium marinum]